MPLRSSSARWAVVRPAGPGGGFRWAAWDFRVAARGGDRGAVRTASFTGSSRRADRGSTTCLPGGELADAAARAEAQGRRLVDPTRRTPLARCVPPPRGSPWHRGRAPPVRRPLRPPAAEVLAGSGGAAHRGRSRTRTRARSVERARPRGSARWRDPARRDDGRASGVCWPGVSDADRGGDGAGSGRRLAAVHPGPAGTGVARAPAQAAGPRSPGRHVYPGAL